MKKKPTSLPAREKVSLYKRIRQILESARTNVSRTVNTTQVVSNWLIGREIVEQMRVVPDELIEFSEDLIKTDKGKGP